MGLVNLFGALSLESTQSDSKNILDTILNFLDDISSKFARLDVNGRQAVRLEAIDSGLQLSTISTVATVNTLTTVTSVSQFGLYSTQLMPFQQSFPVHIYDRIVVS